MVAVQLHYITNREEIFDFCNKKCRIYAACGVSQTPKYFHDKKEKQILEKLKYMSSNRTKFQEEKPHYFLYVEFPKGKPVIAFRSGRYTSYWDLSFDDLHLEVRRRSSIDSILNYFLILIIDLICLFIQRTDIIKGLILVGILILCEMVPVILIRRFEKKRVRMFFGQYLKDFSVRES